MGSLLTHLLAGGAFGGLALLVMPRSSGVWKRWYRAAAVVVAAALLGMVADLDLLFGTHRETGHNVWVLYALPMAAVTAVTVLRPHSDWILDALFFMPAAAVSHLWWDLLGPVGHGPVALWFPVPRATALAGDGPTIVGGLPLYDRGATLLLLLMLFGLLAAVHRELHHRIGEREQALRFRIGAGALIAVAGLGAVALLHWAGAFAASP